MDSMVNLFAGAYRGKKVFLTGHTGFKGSWMAYWLHQMGADVCGYSLEAPTQPSHWDLLKLPIKSVIGDIRNNNQLVSAMADFKPEIVFHMAAQPLVRLSYEQPFDTFETNVMGSMRVYESVRSCPSVKTVVTITTDKVYENNEWTWGYRENDRLGGKDPYSASKAAMEIMTQSYIHSFFNLNQFGKEHNVLCATVRAGNVIGGGDWAQDRLIPDIVKSIVNNQKVSIRSPYSVRPWQHVLEPLSGYLLLGQKLIERKSEFAQAYNFGPHFVEDLNVGELVKLIKSHWDKLEFVIEEPKVKLHEAGVLRLDITKAFKELNWKPLWGVDKTIEQTISWYKAFSEKKVISTESDLKSYISTAIKNKMSWASH